MQSAVRRRSNPYPVAGTSQYYLLPLLRIASSSRIIGTPRNDPTLHLVSLLINYQPCHCTTVIAIRLPAEKQSFSCSRNFQILSVTIVTDCFVISFLAMTLYLYCLLPKLNPMQKSTNSNFCMFHVERYLPRYIKRMLTSDGETPLILPACPMLDGLIFVSFCLASVDIDNNSV